MKLTGVQLFRVHLPLVAPFRTSLGIETWRDVLLVRVETDSGEGWGECCAPLDPLYSSEYVDGAVDVMKRFFIPALANVDDLTSAGVSEVLAGFRGHRMAKAAVEMAVLDRELRDHGYSFGRYLGVTRESVPAGVSVGIADSIPELLDNVQAYVSEGYVRIKLKIEPGWDLKPVRAVRERFGDALMLQVDANTAYSLADARHLAKLDDFDLLLMEQPLEEEDLLAHAQLAKIIRTPICLDESITSARSAADAITLGACSVINIKPSRVGGYLEAKRIHDVCLAHGVPVWCGGMLETGLGRSANIALAGLPGFSLPGDTSASRRFYAQDITTPVTLLDDGHVAVPRGPGFGVSPLPDALAEFTVEVESVPVSRA